MASSPIPAGANYAGDKPALSRGFAVASTDTGHKAKTGAFDFSFMRDQQAYLDFAFLANAEVAGRRQADHRALLRKARGVLLFRRLLHWRARRHDPFAALSHRLQRHRLRRPRHAHRPLQPRHRAVDPRGLQPGRSQRRLRQAADRKVPHRQRSQALHGRADEAMRRKRWRSRRHDLRSPWLRLRSRGPRLQTRPERCLHRA